MRVPGTRLRSPFSADVFRPAMSLHCTRKRGSDAKPTGRESKASKGWMPRRVSVVWYEARTNWMDRVLPSGRHARTNLRSRRRDLHAPRAVHFPSERQAASHVVMSA
jgi:hypothetical protein